jgi:hypothetical protein
MVSPAFRSVGGRLEADLKVRLTCERLSSYVGRTFRSAERVRIHRDEESNA